VDLRVLIALPLLLVTAVAAAAATPPGKFAAALSYSRCMRAHGIPNYPDPKQIGGSIQVGSAPGIDPQSPLYLSAQRACSHLLPNGGEPTQAAREKELARMLQTSRCMRSHGISAFPDPVLLAPSSRAAYSSIMSNDGVWLAIPGSIDERSPIFERAAAACGLGLS
jgi:hypothetical protein